MRALITNCTANLAAGVNRFTLTWGPGQIVVTCGATTTVQLHVWNIGIGAWVAVGVGITATGVATIANPGLYSVSVTYSAGSDRCDVTVYGPEMST